MRGAADRPSRARGRPRDGGPGGGGLGPDGRPDAGAEREQQRNDGRGGGAAVAQNRRSKTVTTSPGCTSASRGARYSTGRPSSPMRVIET